MATFLEFYTTLLGFVNYKLFTDQGLVYPPKLNFTANSSLTSLCSEDEFSDEFLASLVVPVMKKAEANSLDQPEIDQEVAALVRQTKISFRKSKRILFFIVLVEQRTT